MFIYKEFTLPSVRYPSRSIPFLVFNSCFVLRGLGSCPVAVSEVWQCSAARAAMTASCRRTAVKRRRPSHWPQQTPAGARRAAACARGCSHFCPRRRSCCAQYWRAPPHRTDCYCASYSRRCHRWWRKQTDCCSSRCWWCRWRCGRCWWWSVARCDCSPPEQSSKRATSPPAVSSRKRLYLCKNNIKNCNVRYLKVLFDRRAIHPYQTKSVKDDTTS